VKSSVEALEGNKVKVVVELEEEEFEKDLDAAFRRLAKEVRLPGFRPGKAPRKVLEARIGQGYARDEAFKEALPGYYTEAVKEHEVDVIAPPEIDITNGRDEGAVAFDAIVEVRPSVTVEGYEGLEIKVDVPNVTDEDVDDSVKRFLGRFGELETVDRPVESGDTVVVDISTYQDGELVDGMTATDYSYEVGSGTIIAEMDEALVGAVAADDVEFEADHPSEDEDGKLVFSVSVLEVQTKTLPELTDEFVAENSEFDTIEELREDYRSNLVTTRTNMARTQRSNGVTAALGGLVDDDLLPEAMVQMETENRIDDLAMRLQAQGLDFAQYMQYTGQTQEDMIAGMRDDAVAAAKLDLALRSIAGSENIEVTDDDLTKEFTQAAEQIGRSAQEIREEFAERGQLPTVRSSLSKGKALDWIVERVKLVDEDGNPVSADLLELPDTPEEAEEADQDESAEDQ